MSGAAFKRVVLTGDLTIRTAKALHGELLDALIQHDSIEIDCSAASAADLSFLQLLIAARKSAVQAGKTLLIRDAANGVIDDALRRAGLSGLPALQTG